MLLNSPESYCLYNYGPPMHIKCYKHNWIDTQPYVMKSDGDVVGIFCNLCITEFLQSHITNYALVSATKGISPKDIVNEKNSTLPTDIITIKTKP